MEIESLKKGVEIHEEKLEKAKEKGEIELEDYYTKELKG